MREKWYVITAFNKVKREREMVCSSDFGIVAWAKWVQLKLLKKYTYCVLTIRS